MHGIPEIPVLGLKKESVLLPRLECLSALTDVTIKISKVSRHIFPTSPRKFMNMATILVYIKQVIQSLVAMNIFFQQI